jgi:hypothetical protein
VSNYYVMHPLTPCRFINGQWATIPYFPVVATLPEIVLMAQNFTRVFKFGMASSCVQFMCVVCGILLYL